MAKLDDFLGKKKESAPILDLSRSVANTHEEWKKLMERVPDFKMKPEKVGAEGARVRERGFRFRVGGRKEVRGAREAFAFLDPLPKDMRALKVEELAAVPIEWKMLTTVRPKSKIEENYFTRLVELKKLEIKTRVTEKRQLMLDPQIRKSKNKAGVVEMRAINCVNCGEDFCDGKACAKFTYDSFARQPESVKPAQKPFVPDPKQKTKRKLKPKTNRPKTKKRTKSPRKKKN